MTSTAKQQMTVDEFIAWAETQPGKRELHDGLPVAMPPERVLHGDTKYAVARALDAAIRRTTIECRFVLDSALVRVAEHRSYQPDALVYCGEQLPGDTLEIPKPLIVVEVLSPSNALFDLRDKLVGYFQVPSIQHYLILDADKRLVIHHQRGEGEDIATRLVTQGELKLDPPGLTLAFDALFPPQETTG